MIIEELKVCGEEEIEKREESCLVLDTKKGISQNDDVFGWDAKRVLVGAGARALFYPTLLYNVVRNKFEPGFRWWDRVDEFILLGAVPFPTDVPRLKELGVRGVITLNEPYETLVPTSLYHVHDIDHLVIPTRDYCFAPSSNDVFQAVEFIHSNASRGQTTYVHCKAGRGRSTTIVLCYLVQYRQMTPDAAFEYVRLIRPRVLLASAQRKAVQDYYHLKVKSSHCGDQSNMIMKAPTSSSLQDLVSFDDCTAVIITDADLDGYDSHLEWAEVSLVYRVRLAGKTALAGLSCLFLRCRSGQNISGSQLSSNSCSSNTPRVQDITVDIHLLRSHKSNTKDS